MQYGPLILTAAVLLAIAATAPSPLHAQEEPELHRQASSQLAAGDTVAAIATLRGLVEAEPDFGPGFLWLGALLSARSTELDADWKIRREAMGTLQEAWRIMGADPEVLLEYGLLLRKQNIRVDAKRVLERAWKAAQKKGDELDPKIRARLHYRLGSIYEISWEDVVRYRVQECGSVITCDEVQSAIDTGNHI